jgi:hypothetical protein
LADNDASVFALREHILLLKAHRVIENIGSRFERHTMLLQIRCGFTIVPAEVKIVVCAHRYTIRKFRTAVNRATAMLIVLGSSPTYWWIFMAVISLESGCGLQEGE